MYYIQRRDRNGVETVDQFDKRSEAVAMLHEYRFGDPAGFYYLSTRACGGWHDDDCGPVVPRFPTRLAEHATQQLVEQGLTRGDAQGVLEAAELQMRPGDDPQEMLAEILGAARIV